MQTVANMPQQEPEPTQALHPRTQGCCILTRVCTWKTVRSVLLGDVPPVKPHRIAMNAEGDRAAAAYIARKAVLQPEMKFLL